MHPILFEIAGFPVYTYGVLLAAAYLLGLQFALMRARTRGLDPNRVMDLGIWIIISALVGAKLLLVIVEFDTYKHPAELMTLMRSGGVFYGGLIAAVAVAL
ncbi:MAG TPA: prolipoprotein diacylglyceryl transferase family protein, partial [Vicinamibacterales bacterium]